MYRDWPYWVACRHFSHNSFNIAESVFVSSLHFHYQMLLKSSQLGSQTSFSVCSLIEEWFSIIPCNNKNKSRCRFKDIRDTKVECSERKNERKQLHTENYKLWQMKNRMLLLLEHANIVWFNIECGNPLWMFCRTSTKTKN